MAQLPLPFEWSGVDAQTRMVSLTLFPSIETVPIKLKIKPGENCFKFYFVYTAQSRGDSPSGTCRVPYSHQHFPLRGYYGGARVVVEASSW